MHKTIIEIQMLTGKFKVLLILFTVVTFISCDGDNSPTVVDPDPFIPDGMVLIQSKDQSFQMGSDNGTVDEQPVHTVNFTRNSGWTSLKSRKVNIIT
jgi:hypothetical protein